MEPAALSRSSLKVCECDSRCAGRDGTEFAAGAVLQAIERSATGYKVRLPHGTVLTGSRTPGLQIAELRAMLTRMRMNPVKTVVFALASLLLAGGSASAHPHVWISSTAEVVYAPDGTVKGVRHAWTFDEMFSVFATQGIDTKKKGEFTREELMPLAKTNVESLKEFDYFTLAKADGKNADFTDAVDYYLTFKDSALTLHFTLPFKTPVKAKDLVVEVYDPSYFVDFSLAEKDPVALVGAPTTCKLVVARPGDPIPGGAPAAPMDPAKWGQSFANRILVKCQ